MVTNHSTIRFSSRVQPSCALAVEVWSTQTRVSTLMPTIRSSKRVGGSLKAGTSKEFGRVEVARFRYLP